MKAVEFGKYLRELRNTKKLTIRQLDAYSGVSNSYISQMERGERGVPSPEILLKLSKPLGVDYDVLMERAGHIARKPDDYGLTPIVHERMIKLPILGSIRAGEPLLMSEHIEGYDYMEPELLRGREGFILRVKGNSMVGDRIHDGDLVVVVSQQEAEPSDIAVVSIDNQDATLKRVKYANGQCVLTSSNPAYEPMIYPASTIHILGVVVQVKFNLK